MPKTSVASKTVQQDLFLNALADAFRLQEAIISTTEFAIISTDTDGRITSFNKAAEQLTGYTASEMVNRNSPLIFHDGVQLIHRADELATEVGYEVEPNLDVLTTIPRLRRIPDHREWTYIRKDGKRFPVLLSVSGLWDERDILMGYAAFAIDITDRKRSEEELLRSKQNLEALALNLQEQNRQLDEFAHIISHNLRSPIGNIKGLISLLDDNSPISDYREIFGKLKNVSTNLSDTMNDLMEMIKVKKEVNVDRALLRFKDMFDKVVQTLEGDLIHCEAHVTFDFMRAPAIEYSRPYLESIFQNLISNAIKYRSPHRTLHIHAETSMKGETIILRVTDNGQGIDLAKHGHKLFGLHKTFHHHKDARGVGLFLVKTQVEALGGNIHAESEPGIGTTFVVAF